MSTKSLISCNEYPWLTFLRREGRELSQEVDHVLAELANLGFTGYEPAIRSVDNLHELARKAAAHNIALPSIYVSSHLHNRAEVETNVAELLAIGKAAAVVGTRIIVTNPSPIRWNGAENKDDDQLATQAAALDQLGAALKELGITLAYHNHDIELRHAAREFHHMLVGTNPANVALCLDAHWIYRGAGNSQVALFDIIELYGPRIAEIHLRQSVNGVWSEALGPGDIDHERLAAKLDQLGIEPLLVLEQAVEPTSPHTINGTAAHHQSLAYLREVFSL